MWTKPTAIGHRVSSIVLQANQTLGSFQCFDSNNCVCCVTIWCGCGLWTYKTTGSVCKQIEIGLVFQSTNCSKVPGVHRFHTFNGTHTRINYYCSVFEKTKFKYFRRQSDSDWQKIAMVLRLVVIAIWPFLSTKW